VAEIEDFQGEGWRGKVYGKVDVMTKEQEIDWKAMVREIKRRDKWTCQSCGKKNGLTVHHIRPRSDLGNDMPNNLITLCKYCHNEIEQLDFKDKWQIVDFKKRKYIKRDNKVALDNGDKDWHKWVYGGSRKPKN